MPAPKSVIKLDYKDGGSEVQFVSDVDATQYYIFELSRAALRDVGNYLRNGFKQAYYGVFKKRTGKAGRATKYKIFAGKSTTHPRLQIGLPTGKVDGFYSYFQEVGTSKTERLGLLQKFVENNVPKIVEIESQYLSGLSGEAERLASLINEGDYDSADE